MVRVVRRRTLNGNSIGCDELDERRRVVAFTRGLERPILGRDRSIDRMNFDLASLGGAGVDVGR